MARVVFDASAVIALLRDEAGSDVIADYVGDALLSTVNLHEVVKALLVRGFTIEIARAMIEALHLELRPHTPEDAFAAAQLYEATKDHGHGLGDRTCMALAIGEGLPALTTDQAWAKLTIPGLTVTMAR
jgi:PIN domain nuclease of toxin-antitoxin system